MFTGAHVEPGTRFDIPQDFKQYGGNLEAEITSLRWSDKPAELYKIWQEKEGTTEDGLCFISAYGYDWILVATAGTFGEDGDYLQVHVNHDGVETDYPMIKFDEKRNREQIEEARRQGKKTDEVPYYGKDGIHYGHDQGAAGVDMLEFPFHNKEPRNILGDFKNVEYIVNGGSYFDGPPQGLDFTGKSSSGGGNGNFWGTISKLYNGALDAVYTGFENLFKDRDDMTVAYDLNDKDDVEGNKGNKSNNSRPHGDILEVCQQLAEEWASRGLYYSVGGDLTWRKY